MPLIPKMILFFVLIVPLTGSIYLVFRTLGQCRFETGRLGIAVITVVASIGISIWIFVVVLFWIQSYSIPPAAKFVGSILLIPYLAGLFALLSFGPAIGISGFNTRRIFKDLFKTKKAGHIEKN